MKETSYTGICTICGTHQTFERGTNPSIRESFPCKSCRFPMRWRDQAAIILDEFGAGQHMSLDSLVASGRLNDVQIYEAALRGPFVQRLGKLPGYVNSYYRPELENGGYGDDGVRSEDLTDLTFDDEQFDLILTTDVMEHLPEIEKAMAETLRVLRPGGCHVFTIPNTFPFPDHTEPRVAIQNGQEINLKPPVYHVSGDGSPCLVYTDYGADIAEIAQDLGGHMSIVRRSSAASPGHMNATFVLRRIIGTGGPRKERKPALQCPMCGGKAFEDFNGRANARCSYCRAVERNRLTWMWLTQLDLFRPDMRVLHLAPELSIMRRFAEISPEGYFPCDISGKEDAVGPKQIHRFDLCSDLAGVADNSYDLILHSHVLEHIGCSVEHTLRELDRVLAPGGHHLFSVPIKGEETIEDLSPDLTEQERHEMFGQWDHMRLFGRRDLMALLANVYGEDGFKALQPLEVFAKEALQRAGIPEVAWSGLNGHTVIHRPKPSE